MSNAPDLTSDPTDDFGIISLAPFVGKDKSLFSSHDKGSLSSFERYEHHDTVVSLDQLDGMWCKDPLIEADLPMKKQSCSLPTQRVERTKFGGQIKSPRCDLEKMSSCYCRSMILATNEMVRVKNPR